MKKSTNNPYSNGLKQNTSKHKSKSNSACIYARTSSYDKGHQRFTIAHQEEETRVLAAKHGLTVAYEHVFTDIDYSGDILPSCWRYSDDQRGRPALASLITAVKNNQIKYIIVRKMERLGSTSEVLLGLLNLFTEHDVYIVATPETISLDDDPSEAFAVSILGPRIKYDTDSERKRKTALKKKKADEIFRLQSKIARLESEIAEL
jgi:DNA invertase Pin-like site-specific DNA recombinase